MNNEKIYGRGPIWHVIREIKGQDLRILDLGCGAGASGEELQKRGHAVYGLDISEAAIVEAKPRLTRAEVIDLDKAEELPFAKGYFDCIILADILEHLRDPLKLLQLTRSYLKDDGYLIISAPNIANYQARWSLLWGRFDASCGPVLEDENHIRFFTLQTLKNILKASGYQVTKLDCTAGIYLPLGGLYLFGVPVVQRMREFISRCCKTMFAYQFVIVARKT